jgi:hypothetical protein
MIKCYFCKHELQYQMEYDGNIPLDDKLECPNGHADIYLNEAGEIRHYILYWDVDPDAKERYKLFGNDTGTFLYYSSRKSHFRNYICVFSTTVFIPVAIRDNTIQMDNLVARIKKMGAFA